MKTINALFWVIATLTGLQCIFFIYRGVSVISQYDGILRWMWVFKIMTYSGILGMGYFVFQIKQTLLKRGYFEQNSVSQLQRFGFLSLLVAILNSLANAGMDTWHYYKKPIGFQEAGRRFAFYFIEHVFDHSLIVYVLVLSILLLAYFTRQAIAVKSENESFI